VLLSTGGYSYEKYHTFNNSKTAIAASRRSGNYEKEFNTYGGYMVMSMNTEGLN